jgi:hypothetical protein
MVTRKVQMGKTGLLVRMYVSASAGNALKGIGVAVCTGNDGQRNMRDGDALIRHGHVYRVTVPVVIVGQDSNLGIQ